MWSSCKRGGSLCEENLKTIKIKVTSLSKEFRKRWESSHRTKSRFLEKFSEWLNRGDFSISLLPEKSYLDPAPKASGRPTKPFMACSDKSKRRKVSYLKDTGADELIFAARTVLYDSGQRIAAKVLQEATTSSNSAVDMRNKMCIDTECNAQQFSPGDALALLVDCNLRKDTYIYLRQRALAKGHDIFPP
mgnify:FL=1